MENSIKLGEPVDPTRFSNDPMNPSRQNIFIKPVSNMQGKRTPTSKQVGVLPNGTINKSI